MSHLFKTNPRDCCFNRAGIVFQMKYNQKYLTGNILQHTQAPLKD